MRGQNEHGECMYEVKNERTKRANPCSSLVKARRNAAV